MKPLELKRGIDLAPMVDIIFLLIAYFLINSTLLQTRSFQVQLPRSTASSAADRNAIQIFLLKNGKLRLGDRQIQATEVTALLRQARSQNPKLSVSVQADATVRYEAVIALMDRVRAAGVSQLQLTTARRGRSP